MFVAAAGLALTGCATRPSSPTGDVKGVTLVDAFVGKTIGSGVFRAPIVGVERRFKALLNGVYKANTLTVVEDFIYEDGVKERLTWRFTRTGDKTWAGRRDDTVGQATVVETGSEIRLDYVADIKSGGTVTRLGFSDVIYRRADGVVINEAIVTRLGLPIGSVLFELRRA